jgi:serine/threonine protein kinase
MTAGIPGGLSITLTPVLLKLKRQGSSALAALDANYELLEQLGRGAYGRVSLAREVRTGQLRAVKTIMKYEHSSSSREPGILQSLNHPSIQKFVEFYEDPDELHIITEFLEGCDLQQLAWPLTAEAVHAVIASLADALKYMHANNVAHCDVKAENVILASDGVTAVLIDYGAAVRLSAFPRIAAALIQEDWHALARLRARLLQAGDCFTDVFTSSQSSTC